MFPVSSSRLLRLLVVNLLIWSMAAVAFPVARAQDPAPEPTPVVRDGSSPATAAGSCWALKQDFPRLPSGAYWLLTPHMEAPQQFYCDQTMDGGGWVLIGQGREGWQPYADGAGDPARLLDRGRSPEDFTPVQLPADTVDGLLSGTAVNQLEEGMRVVRARNSSGTRWQSVDIVPGKMSTWTWAHATEDTAARYRFDNGSWRSGGQFEAGFGTDSLYNRVDMSISSTRDWHRGYGYGSSVLEGSTSPTNYFWSPRGSAPLPYSELYLRPRISSDSFDPIPDEGTPASQSRGLVDNFAAPTTWGVTGNLNGRVAEGNAPVQAFAEIGDTMFVGGNFTHAEQKSTGRAEPRTALAAFDSTTGDLREGFRLEFDNQVKALLELPDGRLLVGGDFRHVNGEPHVGTVVVDAYSGEIDPSWTLQGTNRLSSGLVSVTSLSLSGDFVYLGGNFTHLSDDSVRDSYSRGAGRVRLNGTPDRYWNPEFNGTVVDIDTSAAGDRFYAAGYFTRSATHVAMKATALSTEPGVLPVSDWVFQGSADERTNYQQAIEDAGEVLFVAGSEHSLLGHDTQTFERVSGSITKNIGGDFQAIASNGDITYAGCHCTQNMYENAHLWPTMNRDWTRVDSIQWVGAWDARTGRQLGEFSPYHLKSANGGAWSLYIASDGALWVGGDFLRSHTSLHTSQWNGGWVRYPALDVEAPQTPSQVWADGSGEEEIELRWSAVSDAVAYEVLRDDRVIAHVEGTGATVPRGGDNRFFVRAVDGAGNRSASTSRWLAPTPGEVDPNSPVLIDEGALWRYSYDQGAPAAGWNTVGADRSTWDEGAVPVGYGAGGLATQLTPPTGSPRPVTTWFAHEFTVADPTAFTTATLDYVADDGAVVYLNGREIHRTRMPEGPIYPDTRAHAPISTTAARAERPTVEVPSAWLVEGTNVLAVETHVNYLSSPNLSFDANLMVTDAAPAPEPVVEEPVYSPGIGEGEVWSYWYEMEEPAIGWDTVADVSLWEQGVAPIGWGHHGVATVLDVPAAERARTMYFVKDLDIDPLQLDDAAVLILRVRADDGVLVRLNGEEVGRHRMPEGAVTHHTNAETAVNTATAIADPLIIEIPVAALIAGPNRIAVETHLNYRSSPSITFELSAEVITP